MCLLYQWVVLMVTTSKAALPAQSQTQRTYKFSNIAAAV